MKKSKFFGARLPKERSNRPESYDEEWCLNEVRVGVFDFGTKRSISVTCVSETGATIKHGIATDLGELFPFSPRVAADIFRSLSYILERDFNRDGTLKEEYREKYKAQFNQNCERQTDE